MSDWRSRLSGIPVVDLAVNWGVINVSFDEVMKC